MPHDYIPGSDGEFFTWERNFTTCVNDNAAAMGLLPFAVPCNL